MIDEPDFATSWEHIRAATAQVASGLEMPPDRVAELLHAFGEGHRSGDDRLLACLLAPVLAEEWGWPWFDGCAAMLEGAGVWPLCWHRHGLPPGTRFAAVPRTRRVEYLTVTLATAAYGARAIANLVATAKVFTPTLQVEDDRCPAEALMCERHRPAVEAGDFNRMPPFFPMDGVHLRLRSHRDRH